MATDLRTPSTAVAGPPPRPWPVWVVAAQLVVYVGLVLWSPVRHHEAYTAADVGVAVVFAFLAVAVVLWRRVGWWSTLPVLVLLLLVQVTQTLDEPRPGNLFGVGFEAVAVALLLLPPSVRRRRRWRPEGEAPGTRAEPVPWPAEWHRPVAGGWPKLVLLALFALLSLVVGGTGTIAAMTSSDGPPPGAMAAVLGFGLALTGTLPAFSPRRTGTPVLREFTLAGRTVTGLGLPYSRLRTSGLVGGCAGFVVAGLAMAMSPAPDSRYSASTIRIIGVVCCVVFGLGLVVLGRRVARRWWIVATPELVGTVDAPGAGTAPWSAVGSIEAGETTTYTRGFATYEPHIRVHLDDGTDVEQPDTVDRVIGRMTGTDGGAAVQASVRAMAVDPALALATLRFYLAHPELRDELGDRRSLERVCRADLA